jgi:Subtilase family
MRRLAALAAVAVGLLATAAATAPQAGAWWKSISPTRSASAPFTVCPPAGPSVRCSLIEDPTRGSRTRGPVPAGAITRGPEQEVSPAFSGHGEEGGFSPADLRSAYLVPGGTAGTGQTVAVVEAFDDPSAEADLAEYRRTYELPSCGAGSGCFMKANQRGGQSLPAPNGLWAEETSSDLDMVSAICPNCHILVVEAENAESQNIATAEDEAVTLGATEISDSFAQSTPLEAQEAAAYDHPGIPIAAAAGDHGFGVIWPAASRHVIAVGGATLEPPVGRGGWTETAWSKTGGGCSSEAKPAWQTDKGCTHRTTNDVAAVADPNTPVSTYDSFETHAPHWQLAGGTSVAAPIVAAMMALASPYTRSFDGAQSLYLEQANGIEGFSDVLSGSTGGCGTYLCNAGAGYDGPTGLGSLRGVPEVPPPAPVTLPASQAAPGEATLEGTVNPHDASVTCVFEYGQSSYGEVSKPCSPAPGTGVTPVAVSAKLTGLTPGATYHYRLAVSYTGGSAAGEVLSFTAASEQPSVLAQSAAALAQTSATLNATIDPGGAAVEACWFEYGQAAPAYGSFAYCTSRPGAGTSPVPVSAAAGPLQPNTTYHFRVYIRTGAGHEVLGSDQVFTTRTLPPTLSMLAASALGPGSATLNASIDPNGSNVTLCEFEFDSGASFVPCSPQPGSGGSPVTVSATVAGLSPSTRYLYRVVATNAGGNAYGPIGELTTAANPGGLESALREHPLGQSPTQGQQPTGSSGACAAHIASKTLLASPTGAVKLTLLCAHKGSSGRGTVTLLVAGSSGPASRSSSRASTVLAVASFTMPAGGAAAVVLHLSTRARHLLARAHLLHARAVIVTRPPLAASTSSAPVTLRAQPRR